MTEDETYLTIVERMALAKRILVLCGAGIAVAAQRSVMADVIIVAGTSMSVYPALSLARPHDSSVRVCQYQS